jgi:subtilisin family serine protease
MKLVTLLPLLVAAVITSHLLYPVAATGVSVPPEVAPGRIVVKFKPGAFVSQSEFGALGATVAKGQGPLEKLGVRVLQVPLGREKQLAEAFEKRADVEFAEPDYMATVQLVPDDPLLGQQWNLAKVDATRGWDYATGSGIVVAVIDTGIDASHPDLASQIVTPTTVLSDTTTHDGHGHGTHVAGIVAAAANNGIGVAGMAFGARIMPIKALDDAGNGRYSDVANAVVVAADAGARVINLSLGGRAPSQLLTEAVQYAMSKGALVLAAAGNSGSSGLLYPAAIPGVVAVGSTDHNDGRSYFSNYGAGLGVVAPGENVVSTIPCPPPSQDPTCSGGYGTKTGTSMSTPLAAGVAALVWSLQPQLRAEDVKAILEGTAIDLGAPGWDAQFGYGRIDASQAAGSVACLKDTATYYLGPVDTSWNPVLYAWTSSDSQASLYSTSGAPAGGLSATGVQLKTFSGWPSDFSGYVKLTAGSCSNPVLVESPVGDSPGTVAPAMAVTAAAVPLRTGGGFDSGLYLINAAAGANPVSISLYNTMGALVHRIDVYLEGQEAKQLKASDLGLVATGWTWAKVEAAQPIAVYGYWRRTFGSAVYFPAVSSATDQLLPAVRRGVDGWVSQIWLINPNAEPAEVSIAFQGAGTTIRTLRARLPGNGFAVADSGRARVPVGWEGTVRTVSDRPVYALNVMYKSSKRQVAVLGSAPSLRTFHSPAVFKNWLGWYTVLKAFNIGPATTSVAFRVILDGTSFVLNRTFVPVGPLRVVRYPVASSSALGNPFAGGVELFAGQAGQAMVELSNGGRTYFYLLR